MDELAEKRLWDFALAFDRLAKVSTSISKHNLRTASQKLPARCRPAP